MANHTPAHLLVVDDNADNRDVLTRRLNRLGHTSIDIARDGQEALDAIARLSVPYDAILLDVMMPHVNGIEVLEALAADGRLVNMPVIMISASTEIDTVVRCIELGAEDYLPKPFNPVLLRARLGAVLEKKRLRDALQGQLAQVESELAEARLQQLSMVPDEFPPADPAHPVTVHALMVPAREVGGDLYDCFEAAPGMLCVAVGDVSGKGVSAALFMARTRSLLRASALQHVAASGAPPPPSALAAVLNEELCKNNPFGMFVTLFVGFLHMASGRLEFVNAGHPRPVLLSPGMPVSEVVTRPDPPLGVLPEWEHADHALTLTRGQGLVVFSDGLSEMTDPAGSFYGLERVLADLQALSQVPPAEITAALIEKASAFAAGSPMADDLTVLALRRG